MRILKVGILNPCSHILSPMLAFFHAHCPIASSSNIYCPFIFPKFINSTNLGETSLTGRFSLVYYVNGYLCCKVGSKDIASGCLILRGTTVLNKNTSLSWHTCQFIDCGFFLVAFLKVRILCHSTILQQRNKCAYVL